MITMSGGSVPAGMSDFFEFLELLQDPEKFKKKAEELKKLTADSEKIIQQAGGVKKAQALVADSEKRAADAAAALTRANAAIAKAKVAAAEIVEDAEEDMAAKRKALANLEENLEERSKALAAQTAETQKERSLHESAKSKYRGLITQIEKERKELAEQRNKLINIRDTIGAV